MCEQNDGENQTTAEESEYDLDSLLEMDWAEELAPLVGFLNLNDGYAELQRSFEKSTLFKDKSSVDHVMGFHKDVTYILEELRSLRTWEGARELAKFLTPKLQNMKNEIAVVDLKTRQFRVNLFIEKIIDELWADFICVFLSRGDWLDKLGRCPECKKWLEKKRRDQIYCSDLCRSKASYKRHQEERRESRRARYMKNKRI